MPSDHLYTVILEFRGGTYIAQVTAHTPHGALRIWVDVHSDAELSEWKLTRELLRDLIREEDPVSLTGIKGVFCMSGIIGGHYALLNIVQTEQSK